MCWNTSDPPNAQRIAPGRTSRAMLMAGEIDAGIALTGLDPAQVRTVIPDADAAAADWYARTGAYPVNHVVCVKRALLEQHRLAGSRTDGRCSPRRSRPRAHPVPRRAGSRIVGDDVLPYGLAANRRGIELCVAFAAQQGLIPRAYRPEELFAADPDLKELAPWTFPA